ncbi:aldose 1-epimerase [Sphingomonas sp. KRR8]|uniref:aldose 1-epimerase n=1 Tax=Sphingomonas sp. KRR8 TaxID=2942996 RepID=UPI002021C3BA|nr:aldose 1-epimerase [Sphingomonas sp. KRR8]URD60817.1 aldose 1-epimerase [Sphingomonas sp. KRR8]
MADSTTITLAAGPLLLELSPSIGGSIRNFFWIEGGQQTPLLRESHSDDATVLDHACFPLVPYVNRIRGGEFRFRGEPVSLAPNMAGDPSPLHGQGWLGSWSVEQADATMAELHYRHEAGEWPWDYEARQTFVLDEKGLSVRLECGNMSDRPMPCGLGQHPYFPCDATTRLDTRVETVWEIDEHVLPTRQVPATGRYDLSNRAVCGQDLDHGFGGWGGEARIWEEGGPRRLTLSSPQAKFFQLYSPPAGGIFVAEPVTHANAALNEPEERWGELGMRVLEPGESMALDTRLDVDHG